MTRDDVLEACAVLPGAVEDYKRHWNTVELDGSIDDSELRHMIDHSYQQVVANLPRAARDRLPTAADH
jgi:hypothetical protein